MKLLADILIRSHQLHRHVDNLHLLLPCLPSPRLRSQTTRLRRLVSAILCVVRPHLDVYHCLLLRLDHLRALVRLELLLELHYAALYSTSLRLLEAFKEDQIRQAT